LFVFFPNTCLVGPSFDNAHRSETNEKFAAVCEITAECRSFKWDFHELCSFSSASEIAKPCLGIQKLFCETAVLLTERTHCQAGLPGYVGRRHFDALNEMNRCKRDTGPCVSAIQAEHASGSLTQWFSTLSQA